MTRIGHLFRISAVVASIALMLAAALVLARSFSVYDTLHWDRWALAGRRTQSTFWTVTIGRGGFNLDHQWLDSLHALGATGGIESTWSDHSQFRWTRSSAPVYAGGQGTGIAGFYFYRLPGYPQTYRANGSVMDWWSITVPIWALVLCGMLLPGLQIVRALRLRKRQRGGLCPACGYDLRASPRRCPECGRDIDEPVARTGATKLNG